MLLIAASHASAADCQKQEMWRFNAACLKTVVPESTAAVEAVFGKLFTAADSHRKALLSASHEAWREYQRRQCELAFDRTRVMHSEYGVAGSAAHSYQMLCVIRTNESRIVDLRNIVP